jgi:hypothetical protein
MAVWVLLSTGSTSFAAPPPHHFYARFGTLYAHADTVARLDLPRLGISGTLVDFERDLGLGGNSWIPTGEIGYRFNPAWRIELEYLQIDRTNSRSLSRSLQVEEWEFEAGARVAGRFASTLYNLAVHWTPLSAPNHVLSLSLGAHLTDFKLGLSGEARFGENVAFREVLKQKLAPLPTIGANGRVTVAPDLMLVGGIEVFFLETRGYRGQLVDAEAGFLWQATSRLGIGASIRVLDYNLRVQRTEWVGRIIHYLKGPSVYLTLGY